MSRSPWTAHAARGAALVLALVVSSSSTTAVTVARGGRTELRIVVAEQATAAERTAAEELASYLEQVTGARFPLVAETRASGVGPSIFVGPTTRSRELGLEPAHLGPEQWRIVTAGGDLVLVGGRPRGTLYAVYRFLEDQVGVRWWTPYEESVPDRPDLEVTVDAGGQPVFAYRDIHGVRGPTAFHARNRANGHYSFLDEAHGGRESYGPPFTVHTFFLYLPPEEHFAAHPEFYAERHGERIGDRTQLCLTNAAVVEAVQARLEEFIRQAEDEAEASGEAPARLFDVSQNDWGRPCTCANCRALDDREGGHAGSLLHFVNRLADAVADRHPDVRIDTLAYDYTLRPPRNLRPRDNVVIRLADLQYRDFSKPVRHRANRDVRRAVEGWARGTRHLRIWCYAGTFGF